MTVRISDKYPRMIVDQRTGCNICECITVNVAKRVVEIMRKARYQATGRVWMKRLKMRCRTLTKDKPHRQAYARFLFASIAVRAGLSKVEIASYLGIHETTISHLLLRRKPMECEDAMLDILRKEFCHERD